MIYLDPEGLENLKEDRRRFYLRLALASEILNLTLTSPGAKTDKAWAAVGYADTLLERLDNTENTSETRKNEKP